MKPTPPEPRSSSQSSTDGASQSEDPQALRPVQSDARVALNTVTLEKVASWWVEQGWREFRTSFGQQPTDSSYLEQLGVPLHLQFLAERRAAEARDRGEGERHRADALESLDSIPFYSLCWGLLLPLSNLEPRRAVALFGTPRPDDCSAEQRSQLLDQFLVKPMGLTLEEKVGCLLCDPCFGRASRMKQDSLLRLLLSSQMVGRAALLRRLAEVGEVAALFAECRPLVRTETPLTAAEVLRTLRLLAGAGVTRKDAILRSLLSRCGKLEAYFLARLLLGRNGPALGVPLREVVGGLSRCYCVPVAEIERASALTDLFRVARTLADEGVEGLRRIRLEPLSPVRPALAGGTVERIESFPLWVERKYDGVRFLLHKRRSVSGAVGTAAYTRNGNNWLDLVPGLDAALRQVPADSLILDGELYGTILGDQGPRPASVYEVVGALQGDEAPISLKYAAFDLLFLNGGDVTGLPLQRRQLLLSNLFAAFSGTGLPVPMAIAQGQLARDRADVNRLYAHFRAQGHEGIIAKQLNAPYAVGTRDATWLKRKAEVTLDLALLGATYAVNERHPGAFGSYVLGARRADGGFDDIGDVDGVDRIRDREIQDMILRQGLITGRTIERKLTEGSRLGIELNPAIVVTVVFQEVLRESENCFMLRHPRIKMIRADKRVDEVDTTQMLASLYHTQGVR